MPNFPEQFCGRLSWWNWSSLFVNYPWKWSEKPVILHPKVSVVPQMEAHQRPHTCGNSRTLSPRCSEPAIVQTKGQAAGRVRKLPQPLLFPNEASVRILEPEVDVVLLAVINYVSSKIGMTVAILDFLSHGPWSPGNSPGEAPISDRGCDGNTEARTYHRQTNQKDSTKLNPEPYFKLFWGWENSLT